MGIACPHHMTLFVTVHLNLHGFTEYICIGKSHEVPCGVSDGVRSLNRSEDTMLGGVTLLQVTWV